MDAVGLGCCVPFQAFFFERFPDHFHLVKLLTGCREGKASCASNGCARESGLISSRASPE